MDYDFIVLCLMLRSLNLTLKLFIGIPSKYYINYILYNVLSLSNIKSILHCTIKKKLYIFIHIVKLKYSLTDIFFPMEFISVAFTNDSKLKCCHISNIPPTH